MAYTREGTASYDPTTNRVNKNSSPMDKAYDDLVAAIAESNYRRTKSSDTSRMNKVYKPKSSPGPIGSSANVREGRSPDRSPKPNRSNVRENRLPKTTPNANTREGRLRDTVKAKPTAKPAGNLGGFKPGTAGYKAIKAAKGMGKDLKKAYQGK